MVLGKMVLAGMLAIFAALQAHALPACETHRRAKPAAEAPRKPVKVAEATKPRAPARSLFDYSVFGSVPSRRLILQ